MRNQAFQDIEPAALTTVVGGDGIFYAIGWLAGKALRGLCLLGEAVDGRPNTGCTG